MVARYIRDKGTNIIWYKNIYRKIFYPHPEEKRTFASVLVILREARLHSRVFAFKDISSKTLWSSYGLHENKYQQKNTV